MSINFFIFVAFCGQINDEIIKRRGPQDGYDECCLGVNQSSSDDGSDEVLESRIPQQTLQQPQRLTTVRLQCPRDDRVFVSYLGIECRNS